MRYIVNWFLPGTALFLIGAVGVGVAMLYGSERMRRAGRLLLLLVAAFYLFGSTRLGADLLVAPLHRHDAALTEAAAAQGATAVVILNAGADTFRARGTLTTGMAREQALRILEGARVYRLLGNPIVIVAGGYAWQIDRPPLGEIYAKELVELGVPRDRIVIEPRSENTRQHAEYLRPYLERHQVKRFVLVTSGFHMRRSAMTFRAAGYDFVTSAAAPDSDFPKKFDSPFMPDPFNLERLEIGAHEYLGLIYYWWKGWL